MHNVSASREGHNSFFLNSVWCLNFDASMLNSLYNIYAQAVGGLLSFY